MPIDSRDKRFSLMGMGSAFVRLLQNPLATIAQSGRQLLEFLYSGILSGAPAVAAPRKFSVQASRATAISVQASRATAISAQASET